MTEDQDYRETLGMFLSASYLPTDDPSRVATIADRLAEVPDHMILNGWQGVMASDAGPVLSRVRCPYLYIDCGQPHPDWDLLGECARRWWSARRSARATRLCRMCGPDQRHAQPFHPA